MGRPFSIKTHVHVRKWQNRQSNAKGSDGPTWSAANGVIDGQNGLTPYGLTKQTQYG